MRNQLSHSMNLIVLAILILLSVVCVSAADPVLFFSDLVSGPRSGNSDTSNGRTGLDGCIVTLWGRNLGVTRGSSKIYANGVEAASYYFWGDAASPSDLYTVHGMQMVSFQVHHLAADGPGQIFAVVAGIQSNSLPFSVRDGTIYFANTSGNDDTGNGSWTAAWRTIQKATDSLNPGDIAYVLDGVDQIVETGYSAAVNLCSDGTAANPKALIVYPGATSRVGNTAIERAFHVWNMETGTYSLHWVIAKFTITTGQIGVSGQTGFRVVGNYLTAPNANGLDGAIGGIGDDVFILGNELENVGGADCSKLYHAIYITGARKDTGPRAPMESSREVAWNYIHDCMSNRAINIYSEQDYSAFIQWHAVHDNAIFNQRGDGIMIGYYVVGENWIYNNLIVNSGLGPEWSDDPSYHTGMRINTGHETVEQTVLYVYNNTLYGNGWSGAAMEEESGSLLIDQGALDRFTAVHISNNIIESTGEPYMAGESASLPQGDYRNCWFGDGAAPAWDTSPINDDPDFVNAADLDFQIQEDSPCRDSGRDVSPLVSRDFLGTWRPQGQFCDIGAFEFFTGSVPSTPTPVCSETGVSLWMPSHQFASGDPCTCTASVCNATGEALAGYPLFVILDIHGAYFFAPSFTEFDNYVDTYSAYNPGMTPVHVLPDFDWPGGVDPVPDVVWYAGLTDPGITGLYGKMDTWEFGWE